MHLASPSLHNRQRRYSISKYQDLTLQIAILTNNRHERSRLPKETLAKLQEEEREKVRLRTEKRVQDLRDENDKKRRQSLIKVKKEEKEKIRQRTETKLETLKVEQLEKDNEQDRLFPS